VFHGDPHAGNLLYDARTGELVIIDWALRERLSREQRRHLALLFLMVTLRDPVGATNEVAALAQKAIGSHSRQAQIIRECVRQFLDEFPMRRLPSGADAMRLLERVALKGVRFPGALIMLAKVMFTLEGILDDIGGQSAGVGFTIARHVAQHWITHRGVIRSPLRLKDWLTLQCSALLYGGRFWVQCERAVLDRVLPSRAAMA
jgi:predicted unusual protein kinase regulating ubiquinone biosynthesis (AarF/ABC1/UbiB family)